VTQAAHDVLRRGSPQLNGYLTAASSSCGLVLNLSGLRVNQELSVAGSTVRTERTTEMSAVTPERDDRLDEEEGSAGLGDFAADTLHVEDGRPTQGETRGVLCW